MKWNWKRIACLVGGIVLGGVGVVFPAASIVTIPLAKTLIAGGAGLVGVAVRTPGHVPAAACNPGEDLFDAPTQP